MKTDRAEYMRLYKERNRKRLNEYKRNYNRIHRMLGLDPEYNRRKKGAAVPAQRVRAWVKEQRVRGFDRDFWETIGT